MVNKEFTCCHVPWRSHDAQAHRRDAEALDRQPGEPIKIEDDRTAEGLRPRRPAKDFSRLTDDALPQALKIGLD